MMITQVLFSCSILLQLALADAPKWVTCAQVASKFNEGLFNSHSYSCPSTKALGEGSSGVVYLLEEKGKKFAGKVAELTDDFDKEKAKIEEKVFKAGAALPNIAKFYKRETGKLKNPDTSQKVNLNFVLMEFATHGSLDSFYANNKAKFDDPRFLLQIVLDLARGAYGLHQAKWVHADIKIENAMVTDGYVAKLIDFDLSVPIDTEQPIRGTPYYLDPRLRSNTLNLFDQYVDVYCLGILMFDLWNGVVPFLGRDVSELSINAKAGDFKFKKAPEYTLAQLIVGCLNKSITNRPTMAGLISKIETYLRSSEDRYIERLSFKTSENPTLLGEVVTKTENRQTAASQFQTAGRFSARILTQIDEGQEDKKVGFLPLIWVISAVGVFLVFMAISRWIDGVMTDKLLAPESKVEGAEPEAGIDTPPATQDIQVPIQMDSP